MKRIINLSYKSDNKFYWIISEYSKYKINKNDKNLGRNSMLRYGKNFMDNPTEANKKDVSFSISWKNIRCCNIRIAMKPVNGDKLNILYN